MDEVGIAVSASALILAMLLLALLVLPVNIG